MPSERSPPTSKVVARSGRQQRTTMAEAYFVLLDDRGILKITGEDRRDFLQGVVSNDARKLAPDHALYAAFLTAQGKYLHDFFLVEIGDAFYLDCEKARVIDLKRRLSIYKLRAKVALADASDRFFVAAVFGADALAVLKLPCERGAATTAAFAGGITYVDPRLVELGARVLLPGAGTDAPLMGAGLRRAGNEVYDRLRLSLGVPNGSQDLPIEKATLLEAGFDELNGVDWDKGCYIGQELTARTKYRALIRKRLMPVTVEGPLPEPGTVVMLGDQEAGEVRSGRGDRALALLRLEAVEEAATTGTPLTAGSARLKPVKPRWAKF